MKRLLKRKSIYFGLAAGLVLALGGTAFAFFTSTGSGTGVAKTGTTSALTITQVGAAYDSLIPGSGDPYVQDQTFGGAGLTQFGNEITLATTGQLSDVVVPFRNWGAATSGPVTLDIYNPVGGSVADGSTPGSLIASETATLTIGAAISINTTPSDPVNLTFDFSSQDVTLPSTIVFAISFDPNANSGALSSVNPALSSSATDISVGSDPAPGYAFINMVNSTWAAGWSATETDCDVPTVFGTLAAIKVDCGSQAPDNTGAYGTSAGNDIPAVEFNVLGGIVPPLYPGDTQNIGYAFTNPGHSVHVNSVTVSVPYDPSNGEVETTPGETGTDAPGCYASWYQINNSPQTLNTDVGTGTTLFGPTEQNTVAGDVISITMLNPNVNQDACQGVNVPLVFSSN